LYALPGFARNLFRVVFLPLFSLGVAMNNVERPVSKPVNKLNDPAVYNVILEEWIDYFGGLGEPEHDLDEYKWQVDKLIADGGSVFRILFVNHLSEIDTRNFGTHWCSGRYHLCEYGSELNMHYGNGKTCSFIVEAIVPPQSISNEKVDIYGNPKEKEVNIVANFEKIEYIIHDCDNNYQPTKIIARIPAEISQEAALSI
jgi:hypothetical protein